MLTEFIRYLSAERRYSPLTVRNYKHDVEQFLAWLDCDESRFDPRSVTTEQIREWIIFRTEEGKLSAGSMNRALTHACPTPPGLEVQRTTGRMPRLASARTRERRKS